MTQGQMEIVELKEQMEEWEALMDRQKDSASGKDQSKYFQGWANYDTLPASLPCRQKLKSLHMEAQRQVVPKHLPQGIAQGQKSLRTILQVQFHLDLPSKAALDISVPAEYDGGSTAVFILNFTCCSYCTPRWCFYRPAAGLGPVFY